MSTKEDHEVRPDVVGKLSPDSERQLLTDRIDGWRSLYSREKEIRELKDQIEYGFSAEAEQHLGPKQGLSEPVIVADVLKYTRWCKVVVEKDLIKNAAPLALKEQYEEPAWLESPAGNREAFLDARSFLLANHRGEFVAFIERRMVAVDASVEGLVRRLQAFGPLADVYVELVHEAAFDEPAPTDMPGLHQLS